MNRIYTASFSAVAVSAAQDVFEIVAPSNARVTIRKVVIGQYSDFADAEAEILSVKIIRGHTTSGSGGSSVTPTGPNSSSPLSGSTVERNNTTVATTSGTDVYADVMNVAAGWYYEPLPEERISISGGERLVVRITAPADALTMNGTIVFEETPPMHA